MVDANAGSTAGGDSISLDGHGFDGANLQVTIGGKQATVTQVISRGPNFLSREFSSQHHQVIPGPPMSR